MGSLDRKVRKSFERMLKTRSTCCSGSLLSTWCLLFWLNFVSPPSCVDSKAPRLTVKIMFSCVLAGSYVSTLYSWRHGDPFRFFKPIWWLRFQPWTHVDTSAPLASAKPRIWIIWPWQTCGRAITRRPIHGIISTGSTRPGEWVGKFKKNS